MKQVAIIGAGASAIYSALLIKRNHPDYEVTLFDKEQIIGRKLLATGNGHCNLLNMNLNKRLFNNRGVFKKYLSRYSLSTLLETIHSFGIPTQVVGDGIYPLSYSAKSYVDCLIKLLQKEGVKIQLDTKIHDYAKTEQKYTFISDKGNFEADLLLFCIGGKSMSNLGSDGSLFSVFEKHGYSISPLRAGLTPVVVKEKRFMKALSGERHKASVSLFRNNKYLTKEDGELLFKDDGLSGICIFNLSSVIARYNDDASYRFEVDLFPNQNLNKELRTSFELYDQDCLNSLFTVSLAKEVKRQFGQSISENSLNELEERFHHLKYDYECSYPFKNSQVTVGGVSFSDLNDSLMSKSEKDVYFLGEALDMDGLCGGNNLAWALLSALVVSDSL